MPSNYSDVEALFEATFEQAAVGLAHVSSNGTWLRVNQRLCAIVGYTREALLQMTFQDITYPADLDTDMDYMRQMLRGEIQTYAMEKRYFHKDGSIIWINLTVALVRRVSGEPDYFIAVIEDISARKTVEAEIVKLSESLIRVQESERQFLALELHDEVGQQLSAIKITIGLALKKCSEAAVRDLLVDVDAMSNKLICSIKSIAHVLRPSQLNDFGLTSALRDLIEDIGSRSEITLALGENIGDRRFDADIELTAYRIVQESISNLLRHAGCQKATVSVTVDAAVLELVITDNGRGFDLLLATLSAGIGLIGMRKRAETVGGTLQVDTMLHQGTVITARLPLKGV